MNSIIQTIREKNLIPGFSSSLSLPLSQSAADDGGQPTQPGLRRRLSSLSFRIQQQVPSPGPSWSSFRRSKSVSSMGDYYTGGSIRKWWEQGWSWIMSRKPILARDLEMSEEEGRVLGAQNKGSLKHVLFKVRSEIMKLVGSDNNVALPR